MINSVAPYSNTNKKLSIFYVNDVHGNTDNIDGIYAASKTFDKKVEKEGTSCLKLSAGDNYSGGDGTKNNFVLSMFKQMGIKYSAVGNHEFDANCDSFSNNIKNNGIDFISSNLNIDKNNELSSLIKTVAIEEIDGEKYGIVGLTTDELKTCAASEEAISGVTVTEGDKKLQEVQAKIDELKAQGINKIILLSHCGLNEDIENAKKLSGVDIIIGGHSHDVVQGAKAENNVVKDKDGNPTIVVQTGENGQNYGILDVEFDESGILKKINNEVFKTSEVTSPTVEFLKEGVMGKTPQVGNVKSVDPFPENKRTDPCAWSNLICDSLKSEMDVDIAFMNAANLRKVPQVGKLDERSITETTPFKNTMVKTTMTEKEVVDCIKFGAQSLVHEGNIPGIVQVSGLKYKVDKQGNLLELTFIDKKGKERQIDVQNPSTTTTYSVTYDSFMADGREYPPFDISNRQAEQIDITKDVLVEKYISKMPAEKKEALEIKDDGRVQIV